MGSTITPRADGGQPCGVDRLVLIARHGVGLDFVDLDVCTEHGIGVTDHPEGTTRPMVSCGRAPARMSHPLRERDAALDQADWGTGRFVPQGRAQESDARVIGYGRIGREVVRLLAPWEMTVLVTQRTP